MHYQLKNLEIDAFIGVYDSEKNKSQKLLISVRFDFDSKLAEKSDNLADTLDYSVLEKLIRQICQQRHYELIEKLSAVLRQSINQNFPLLENLEISIEKFPFKNGSVILS